MTGATDSARYEQEHAEFNRLLAAGDIDGARALANSKAFQDALGAAVSEAVVAALKNARKDGLAMPAAHIHALAGHSLALHAQQWASISAQVTKARIESLEKRLAALEQKQTKGRKGARNG